MFLFSVLCLGCSHPHYLYPNTTNTNDHATISLRSSDTRTDSKFPRNTTVTFYCKDGYNLVGSRNLKCNNNATWIPAIPPTCSAVSCSALSLVDGCIPHGFCRHRNTTGNFRYGHEIEFHCHDGYNLDGSNTTRCNKTGDWSARIPKCNIVDCGIPSIGYNSMLASVPSTQFNSTLLFECMTGFDISRGDAQRTCLQTGNWSGGPLHCTGEICLTLTLNSVFYSVPSIPSCEMLKIKFGLAGETIATSGLFYICTAIWPTRSHS